MHRSPSSKLDLDFDVAICGGIRWLEVAHGNACRCPAACNHHAAPAALSARNAAWSPVAWRVLQPKEGRAASFFRIFDSGGYHFPLIVDHQRGPCGFRGFEPGASFAALMEQVKVNLTLFLVGNGQGP